MVPLPPSSSFPRCHARSQTHVHIQFIQYLRTNMVKYIVIYSTMCCSTAFPGNLKKLFCFLYSHLDFVIGTFGFSAQLLSWIVVTCSHIVSVIELKVHLNSYSPQSAVTLIKLFHPVITYWPTKNSMEQSFSRSSSCHN